MQRGKNLILIVFTFFDYISGAACFAVISRFAVRAEQKALRRRSDLISRREKRARLTLMMAAPAIAPMHCEQM